MSRGGDHVSRHRGIMIENTKRKKKKTLSGGELNPGCLRFQSDIKCILYSAYLYLHLKNFCINSHWRIP